MHISLAVDVPLLISSKEEGDVASLSCCTWDEGQIRVRGAVRSLPRIVSGNIELNAESPVLTKCVK
jgi:hypothetical protein